MLEIRNDKKKAHWNKGLRPCFGGLNVSLNFVQTARATDDTLLLLSFIDHSCYSSCHFGPINALICVTTGVFERSVVLRKHFEYL